MLTDETGRPLAFSLTPGQTHDLVGLGDILRLVRTPRHLSADRAYDAWKLREWLAERGCEFVIPPNPTRRHPSPWDRMIYRKRNIIERMFRRLKDFRRVSTDDKRADIYLSAFFLAATVAWWLNRVWTLAASAPMSSSSRASRAAAAMQGRPPA